MSKDSSFAKEPRSASTRELMNQSFKSTTPSSPLSRPSATPTQSNTKNDLADQLDSLSLYQPPAAESINSGTLSKPNDDTCRI